MELNDKEKEILDKKPSVMRIAVKMLLKAINSIIKDECDEDELSNALESMNRMGKDYIHPDEYWSYDKAMKYLGMNNNRVGFSRLMKQNGIKNKIINNVNIGFPSKKIIALKSRLEEERDIKSKPNKKKVMKKECVEHFQRKLSKMEKKY